MCVCVCVHDADELMLQQHLMHSIHVHSVVTLLQAQIAVLLIIN